MLKPVLHECGIGQDQGQDREEGELISPSAIHSSSRRSKRLQEKEARWSSLPVSAPTARATPQSCGNFSGCNACTANILKTPRTLSTNLQGDFLSLTYSGRPSSSVPSCSSPSWFVA